MKQAKETTTKAKAEGIGCFRLIKKGGIIEFQTIQRITQEGIFVTFNRIETSKNHWFRWFITGQGLNLIESCRQRHCITNVAILDIFKACRDIADLPGR